VTQPDYVPLVAPDRIRPSERLTLPGPWTQDRPAELGDLTQPKGAQFGVAGPDLGYGLKLAKRFLDRLVLTEGEDSHDVLAGCFACGTRRAAVFGRAPVIYDMDWAYTLWGFLAPAAPELVALRVPLFRGAGHDYSQQRRVVDTVAEPTLRLTPAQVRERVGANWRSFLVR
jgi:hypothetical protein